MMKFRFLRFGLVAMGLLVAHGAAGKGLSDLKKKAEEKSVANAEKKKEKETKPPRVSNIATSSFGSGTYPSSGGGESFLGSFWSWLAIAPLQHQHDDSVDSILQDEEEWGAGQYSVFPTHALGQATAPYVRIDYNWQYIDSTNDAHDVRIELGYKLIAIHGRMTKYSEETTGKTMDINQYYGVLRYGGYRPNFLPGTFELGIGLGVTQIDFNSGESSSEESSSGALTIPIKYHPTDWFGVEFRPAWYRWKYLGTDYAVGDYDLSASLGYRFVQLRGGYRWLEFQDLDFSLNGPYAGMSVSF